MRPPGFEQRRGRRVIDSRKRILIMGAGERDFHLFNTCYRDDEQSHVIAFTAAQIPHIERRTYPPELAGAFYPDGIPIHSETDLERILRRDAIDEVVFAYSDVSYEFLDSLSARVQASGAQFSTFDPRRTLLPSSKPCVAVCAVRTGCGKSPFSRRVTARRPTDDRRGAEGQRASRRRPYWPKSPAIIHWS